MLHIVLHFLVPILVAVTIYRSRWKSAVIIMVGTMIIDLDHLLADPVYDPERCSIGFHLLHTTPAIVLYAALFLLPLVPGEKPEALRAHRTKRILNLIGLGLIIHIVLDWIDCLV